MQIEDLKYSLVPENIIGTPREFRLGRRDASNLCLVDRTTGTISNSRVINLPEILSAGDLLVLNNSKRIPGVLKGVTSLEGQVELRFVDLGEDASGLCRIFPMHDVSPGSTIFLKGGEEIEILEMDLTQYGLARVKAKNTSLRQLLVSQGTPILGFFYDGIWTVDELNPYYATVEGSVESPLAGLHFTPELVSSLEKAGIEVAYITLHSVGSWLPFMEDSVDHHAMWEESYTVPAETAEAVSRIRKNGGNVVACGSTCLRALESAATTERMIEASSGKTSLYITPGYEFKVVDNYFTNFHQYQTSLMVLDCAFAGEELAMKTYRTASKNGFRFYEFGDAVIYL